MQGLCIVRKSGVKRSARVIQMEGMFDVPPGEMSELKWVVDLPLDARDWNVGLIVGPSGCGKSTIAGEVFGGKLAGEFDWPGDESVLDGFPKEMGIKDVTALLSSVGFSSPPAWLRSFHVLSTGEQFRVNMARVLAEMPDLAVVDEFTSVVDRTVAQIGSAAIAKTVRKRGQRFVAVTCHEDVAEWLQPDWVYCPVGNSFEWRFVRRRPEIRLDVVRVHYSAWVLFEKYHYLTPTVHRSARCFMGVWKGRPVVFAAVMAFPHMRVKTGWRGHRIVCLPDYQGVGIGGVMADFCGALLRGLGKRFYIRTSHPAEKARVTRAEDWRLVNRPAPGAKTAMGRVVVTAARKNRRVYRPVLSAEYMGPGYPVDEALGLWEGIPLKL